MACGCEKTRSGACRCSRCRGENDLVERLANESLSVALRHAQDRYEAVAGEAYRRLAEGLGPEAVIDKDIKVQWGRHQDLTGFLTAPANAKAASPGEQWLYRLFLKGDPVPLYLGRVTDPKTTLKERIQVHARRGKRIRGLSASDPPAVQRAKIKELIRKNAERRAKCKGLPESLLMDSILKSLGRDKFAISVAEVKRLRKGATGTLPARPADTALVEKHYHRKGASRINRADNPRFEEAP